MVLFTQYIIAISFGTAVVLGLASLIDNFKKSRLRHIKYYTLESSDGYRYEMACADRKTAEAEAKALAYSGTAYEHTVGNPNKSKVAFIW